jgi:hypothetical protein
MSIGDFVVLENASTNGRGSRKCLVAAGASTTIINPGEPVARALGAAIVTQMATNKPVVATDFLVGIAETTSTQTAALAGEVMVTPIDAKTTWLANPTVAATFDTQAKYDALVGDRVLIDLTTGAYTVLATDGATSGVVLMPLDVSKYPGKVAVAFRNGVSDLT